MIFLETRKLIRIIPKTELCNSLLPTVAAPMSIFRGGLALVAGGGVGAGEFTNMAARAAAAKPLRPTPAMPASPPIWVLSELSAGGGGGAAAGGISRTDENEGRAVAGEIDDAVDPDRVRAKPPTGGRLRTGESPPDAYGSREEDLGAGNPSPVRESGLERVW